MRQSPTLRSEWNVELLGLSKPYAYCQLAGPWRQTTADMPPKPSLPYCLSVALVSAVTFDSVK